MENLAEDGEETLEKLRSACMELEQAFNVRILERSSALVDHDIKSNLFKVAALVRVLEIQEPQSPETRNRVRALKETVRDLEKLCSDMPERPGDLRRQARDLVGRVRALLFAPGELTDQGVR